MARPAQGRLPGANIKLFRLRDGSMLCAYRDEDPARHGVSRVALARRRRDVAVVGQLYADPAASTARAASCGYPDMVSLGDDRIAAVLHTYAEPTAGADLQFFVLRDRT